MSKEITKEKCSVRDGAFIEPCSALESASEHGNPHGRAKGIFAWVLTKRTPEGFGPSKTFFGVKSGEHKTKGLVLNYCPFCGERIDAPVNQLEKAPA